MNLFNNIEKFNYSDPEKKCVSLEEYIIFEDERKSDKFIVFKFRNNLLQALHEMRFEVYQYDERKNLVEKNVVVHSDFSALPEELFVPNAKLKANYLCKSIGIKLIFAKFDTAYYENDELHAATFSFDKYKEHVNKEKMKNMSAKEIRKIKQAQKEEERKLKYEKKIDDQFSKIEAKNEFLIKEKKVKSKYLRHCFSIKNTSPNNTTHAANAILSIGIVILIGFSLWSTLFYRNTSQYFDDGDFSYYMYSKNDNYAGLVNYYGNDKEVVIPSVGKYKRNADALGPLFGSSSEEDYSYCTISKVENGCFKNANITSVSFENDSMTIGKEAFMNCKNLQEVNGNNISTIGEYAFSNTALTSFTSNNCTSIGEYAFSDCKELTSVTAQNAYVDKNAFANCSSLERIYIGNTNAKNVGELFGSTNLDVNTLNLKYIFVGMKYVPTGFFYDIVDDIKIDYDNVSTTIEEDYRGKERNFDNNAITIENNKLTGISSAVKRLTIPSNISEYPNSLINKRYDNLTSLVVKSAKFDYATLIKNNPQLKEIIFDVDVNLPKGLLKNMSSLVRLEFNKELIINETSPFDGSSEIDWLVITNVNKTSFGELFNDSLKSIHYLVLKNCVINDDFLPNISINGLALVGCKLSPDALLKADISNVYLSNDCILEDESATYKSIKDCKCIMLQSNVNNVEDVNAEVKTSVKLLEYNFSYNYEYAMNANMYFFTYLPKNLASLMDNGKDYFVPNSDLYNELGTDIYTYGSDITLI